MDELRLAFRRLSHRPGASIASILTLACSIGAAAATWSLLSAVLLQPLPVQAPESLFVVGTRAMSGRLAGRLSDMHVYPWYRRVEESGVFTQVAAGGRGENILVGTGGYPVQRVGYFASHNFFEVLGVSMQLGRSFTREEDRRGANAVVLLSDRYWRRDFGAASDVIGRVITVAGRPATIVGVISPGFRGLDLSRALDLYLPLHTVADFGKGSTNFFAESNHQSSPTAWVTIIGRLDGGVTAAQTAARLDGLESGSGSVTPPFGLTPINTAAVPVLARAGMTQFTSLLGATVVLLLMIGCSTVGLLLLVRTEARREEFAMCLALGASRARLARGVALEGALLALVSALAAPLVARWLFDGLRAFQLPGGVDVGQLDLAIDLTVILVTAGGAIAGALVIAIISVALGFSADVADALRSRASVTPRLTRCHIRALLVAGQIAVVFVLLAGAGVFVQSLVAALSLNAGFDTDRIVTSSIGLGRHGYTPVRASVFFAELVDRLSGNKAIESVALSESPGGMSGALVIDGTSMKLPSSVTFTTIDSSYLAATGLRLLEGRAFSDTDRPESPLVGIVSESFGRTIAPGGNPIGRRITMPYRTPPAPAPQVDVVGIVPDVITSVDVLEPLVLYLPLSQNPAGSSATLVVRAATDADSARREVMSTLKQLDPAVVPSPMLTLQERLGQQMGPQRFGASVLGALGVIAVLLTALGMYVLAETMATSRLREMGIRAALGANGRQLAQIVLAETGRLVGLGLAAGLGLAWLGASTIRALLFRVQPLDPVTLSAVAVLILALALAVSLEPALRAARVDLARVLRE